MNNLIKGALCSIILIISMQNNKAQNLQYPVTKKINQTDNYFGTIVSDPYRWLENTDSQETKDWVEAENKVTFDYLSRIPFRDKIKQRLTEVMNYPRYTDPFKAGNYYFFHKNDGLQNQSILYVQNGLNSEPEVFLDPNKLSIDGTVALNETDVSNDNKYMAYCVSASGSDWRDIYVMEIASKKKLEDHIQNVKFSGGYWFKDGFFYTLYDRPKDQNDLTMKNEFPKIYYHKLGTDQSKDVFIYGDEKNGNQFLSVWAGEDEKYIFLAKYETGKSGNSLYFKEAGNMKGDFKPVTENLDYRHSVINNIGSTLLLLTDENAPNYKVMAMDLKNPAAKWKDIIPENENVLNRISYINGKFIAQYLQDATNRVYVYNTDGKMMCEIKLPALGTVTGFEGGKNDNEVFYTFVSFTYPATIYVYNVEKNTSTLFRKTEVKFNPEDFVVKQEFYTSKDGTTVPMFIVHKKDLVLDGTNPTFLYAYGGFDISQLPSFSASRLVLLENGGIFAMPNLRGGGEYGQKWHEGGILLNKQNVFNDFIAAAEYLIREKYTSPEKLAVSGGSNGGLLIGAVINQRPDLFRVAFPAVGVMDMLRFQKFTVGASWATEYGSSDDSINFKNIFSYSPLHNIKEGINYPATLVTTADHDDRVVPSHSFKYIATLQETYHGDNPVLIRIETKAGHGAGKPLSKIIEELADVWSFMFYNMGITPGY